MMNMDELRVLKELVEFVEKNDKEEHYIYNEHDAYHCPLCAGRELLIKYKNKVKLFYSGFSSDGMIMLTIDGVDYSYRVDSARIPKWIAILHGKRPFSAVNEIKKTCHWLRNDFTGEVTVNTERR